MKVTVAELKCALDRLPDPGTHRYNHVRINLYGPISIAVVMPDNSETTEDRSLMFIRQSGHWPEWTLEVV